MIYKHLLVSVLCFSVVFAFAQKPTGTFKGVVKDADLKTAIEFATVSLFKASDSSLVTGSVTNAQGYFEIGNLNNDQYYAKVGFIGFETQIVSGINITASNRVSDVGTISLALFAKNMDEFNVIEERDFIETKIDKKVYNVAKDIGAQGDNGLEVLRNIPSVEVDDEDKISMRGDESVKVLIDGRPSAISPSQLLKQIPASTIEKIEIITNPSAKYDPEGMSGILNVILKKEKASGFNGNVNGGYSYNNNHGYNGSIGLNFRKNKINIYVGTGYYEGTWGYNGVAERRYVINDSTNYQILTDIGANQHTNTWYNGGIDYYPNKNNTLYFETALWGGEGDRFDDNHYDFADNQQIIQTYSDRHSNKLSSYDGYRFNGGWQTKFKKDEHTLDVDLLYTTHANGLDDEIEGRFFEVSGVEYKIPTRQNTSTNGNNYNVQARVDYTLPITDSLVLETGLLSSFEYKENVFYSESSDTLDVLMVDTNLNNDFRYNENTTAFYATLGKQFKKLGIKAGTRIENTRLETELKNTNEQYEQNYLSFFPSIHFSYKIKEGNEYQLSYSKRINRPNMWDLNSFASYSDPYNLYTGNPALKPEYIDVFELSYLRYWDKFNFNTSIYYREVSDKKNTITTLTNEGITISMPENVASSQIKGGEFQVSYKPYKWWKWNTNFNFWSSNVTDDNLNQITSSTYGWSVQLTSTQTIKKTWTLQLRGRYRGRSEDLQGFTYPRYGLNVSVGKTIMKKKGKITLRVSDVFDTRGWHYVSNDLGSYSYESDRKWTSQSINVSFSYSFGKMNYDSQKRQKKSTSAGDSFNSGDSGGNGGQ